MKIFPTFIRRIVQIAGGGAGFIASVAQAGIELTTRLVLTGASGPAVATAVAVDSSRQALRAETQIPAVGAVLLGATGTAAFEGHTPALDVDASLRAMAASSTPQNPAFAVTRKEDIAWTAPTQAPAFAIDFIGATGAAANEVQSPAVAVAARFADAAATNTPQTPAGDITQVTYTLTRRVGGNAQSAVGTPWTNPANAISGTNGLRDGTVATVAGSAGGSSNGIELAYLNHVGKAELAITAATLLVYAEVTGDTTGLLSTMVVSYNIGAGLVTLETIAGNFANLTTPRSYSLPLLDTWTEYDALVARVVETMAALSVGVTARLDAIEIEVVANKTDVL